MFCQCRFSSEWCNLYFSKIRSLSVLKAELVISKNSSELLQLKKKIKLDT